MSTLRLRDVLERDAAKSVLQTMPSRELKKSVTSQTWFELTRQLEPNETLYLLFTADFESDTRGYFITESAHIPDFIDFCAEKSEMSPLVVDRTYKAYAVQRPT